MLSKLKKADVRTVHYWSLRNTHLKVKTGISFKDVCNYYYQRSSPLYNKLSVDWKALGLIRRTWCRCSRPERRPPPPTRPPRPLGDLRPRRRCAAWHCWTRARFHAWEDTHTHTVCHMTSQQTKNASWNGVRVFLLGRGKKHSRYAHGYLWASAADKVVIFGYSRLKAA